MATTHEFRHESIQDRASVVRYLKALITGIERGHLELDSGEQSFVLEPQGLMKLEIRARRKQGRVKAVLKFSWREEQEDATEPASDTLNISV